MTSRTPSPPHDPAPHGTRGGGLEDERMRRLLGYSLAQASISPANLFLKHVGVPFDLRRVEYSLLILVDSNRDVTPKQLARALAVSVPYLTVTLDKLEARGLLGRSRSEVDRRSQHVELTRKGVELVKKAEAAAMSMEKQLLSHFTVGESALLFELLQRVAAQRRA